jgi:glucokinase
MLAFHSESLNKQESVSDFVQTITRIGQYLRKEHTIQAVGMSIKGIVDAQQGTIVEVKEALSEIVDQPIAEQLAKTFNLPVVLENDARMYALGELLYGAGQSAENFVCLTLGTGVGCAVAINRCILRGAYGLAGILGGHISVQADGPPCNCGNRGCLEAFIGTTALVEAAKQYIVIYSQSQLAHTQPLTPYAIFHAAANGDEPAQILVQRFTHYLSVGIVSLIHAYGPDIVVLGGGIMGASSQILLPVQRYVAQHCWTQLAQRVRITAATLGDTAALLGVASLAENGADLLF